MVSKNKLIIIGAGGHGRVVADIARKMGSWQQIVFLDDDESIEASMGMKAVGKTSDAFNYINECDIFIAIGNNRTREKLQSRLEAAGATIPVIIHPKAIVAQQVCLGTGTVLMAGCIINCCSLIGKGCIVNTGATIDHDNLIEDYVHISPGSNLGGKVFVGKSTWVGIGAIIINNINIAAGCIVGAGAVVVNDIDDNGTYTGTPARKNMRRVEN